MRQQDKNFTNPMQVGTDSESLLRLIVNKTPALIYSARPDGYIDFFNQQCVFLWRRFPGGAGRRRSTPTILKDF